jgi:hypothetical protein
MLQPNAATDGEACVDCGHVPTIADQGFINSWPQDRFMANGTVASSGDELHGVGYNGNFALSVPHV